jgi:hypothetical protein
LNGVARRAAYVAYVLRVPRGQSSCGLRGLQIADNFAASSPA